MSAPEFEWPCDRRVAHHGHEVTVCTCASTESSLITCAVHGYVPVEPETYRCPGVPAHPATMISGAYPS